MIVIKSEGRMGNKLNYFFHAKHLNILTGMKFNPEIIKGFKHTYYEHIGVIKDYNWIRTSQIWLRKGVDETNYYGEILKHDGGIIVDHMLVKYENIKEIDIQKYLEIENEYEYEIPKKDELVIHIRLGDYKTINWFTEKYLFKKVIEMRKNNNCIIVTDSPDDIYLKEFIEMGCVIRSRDPLSDFIFLKNANILALSKSTFSWCAGYISDAEVVYFPLSDNKLPYLPNPKKEEHDFIPIDRPEWVII